MAGYGKSIDVEAPFHRTVDVVREALADQGFGVLTEIDVQETMRTKLGEETGPFVILGACNPPLAHRALTAEPSLGLMLPCNVTVRAPQPGSTCVEFVDPMLMVAMTDNPALVAVATDAAARLDAALAAVGSRLTPVDEETS